MTKSLSPFVCLSFFFLLVSLESALHLDVSRKFQECFKRVSRVFRGSFKGVSTSRAFNESFKEEEVSRVFRDFQGRFKSFHSDI